MHDIDIPETTAREKRERGKISQLQHCLARILIACVIHGLDTYTRNRTSIEAGETILHSIAEMERETKRNTQQNIESRVQIRSMQALQRMNIS